MMKPARGAQELEPAVQAIRIWTRYPRCIGSKMVQAKLDDTECGETGTWNPSE